VAAGIQGAAVRTAPLDRDHDFALDVASVLGAAEAGVKLVFLCSPNNPTGQLLNRDSVLNVADALAGRAVVVVDEAYAEFAGAPSFTGELAGRPNLVVLRTLSKAFGLAGARVGATIADPQVIGVLQKIIAPYPVPTPVARAALEALTPDGIAAARRSAGGLAEQRRRLAAGLADLPAVKRVWPSELPARAGRGRRARHGRRPRRGPRAAGPQPRCRGHRPHHGWHRGRERLGSGDPIPCLKKSSSSTATAP
jgi:histidinol-phosphate aminotransferase